MRVRWARRQSRQIEACLSAVADSQPPYRGCNALMIPTDTRIEHSISRNASKPFSTHITLISYTTPNLLLAAVRRCRTATSPCPR